MQTSFGCVLRSLGHFLPQKTSFFAQNAHLVHAEDMGVELSRQEVSNYRAITVITCVLLLKNCVSASRTLKGDKNMLELQLFL